ncbi:helix-turn-helix domain-containing protein [Streptomyces kunmingensis]|uniref:Helix-turn-helix domain-containing protein n=1 Tax=Streptomyces kunmingensis TaxID=68225 RepID=A0ABU6CJK3_9ACTN|nr:helix-turn-helix domain-containing protein [Streptomyces kunmingensis]MEB3964900.1 helix-turn-helix domain-containing protein [Streptomyces kunmingensis]
MTEEEATEEATGRPLPDHPVRVALLDLLAELGTVTSSQAAARLGYSSGLCSFHLRQLARHGLIEEASHSGGRVRPWRLRWDDPRQSVRVAEHSVTAELHLTPDEATDLATRIESLLASYKHRRHHPAGAAPTTVTARLTSQWAGATTP